MSSTIGKIIYEWLEELSTEENGYYYYGKQLRFHKKHPFETSFLEICSFEFFSEKKINYLGHPLGQSAPIKEYASQGITIEQLSKFLFDLPKLLSDLITHP